MTKIPNDKIRKKIHLNELSECEVIELLDKIRKSNKKTEITLIKGNNELSDKALRYVVLLLWEKHEIIFVKSEKNNSGRTVNLFEKDLGISAIRNIEHQSLNRTHHYNVILRNSKPIFERYQKAYEIAKKIYETGINFSLKVYQRNESYS